MNKQSSSAGGDVSAAATFDLLDLATCPKGAGHLDEAIVVEADLAEKSPEPGR